MAVLGMTTAVQPAQQLVQKQLEPCPTGMNTLWPLVRVFKVSHTYHAIYKHAEYTKTLLVNTKYISIIIMIGWNIISFIRTDCLKYRTQQ